MKKWVKRIAFGVSGLAGLALILFIVVMIAAEIDPQATISVLKGGEQEEAEALVGEPAPDFRLKRIGSGKEVSLSDYRGKTVVLDFWATWCSPCESTSPNIEAVRKRHSDVVVLAINVREGENTEAADLQAHVENYFDQAGYGFVNLQGHEALLTKYRAHGIPHVFVIDAEGVVRYSGVGQHSEENIEAAVGLARGS